MKTLPALLVLIVLLTVNISVHGFQAGNGTDSAASEPDPEYSPHGPYTGPLTLPHIVRYRELPMRMHLEPLILPPDYVNKIDERMVPLFLRVVKESQDLEVQEVAALSLARAAGQNLADISHCGPVLREILKSTTSQRVRNACGFALAAGNIREAESDLVRLALDADDSVRLEIEPALAMWKAASAAELWRPRLTDALVSSISYRLAAEGLASLNDQMSLPIFNATLADSSAAFGRRKAAAAAIARMDPDMAWSAAQPFLTGSISDRLLALALLDNDQAKSFDSIASLCADPADAVASVAWQQAFLRHPESLIDYLSAGRTHRDAQIRMTTARAIELFPTAERASWLHQQLSDVHIEVRNVARQMLVQIAEKDSDLKDQIVGRAADMLKPEATDWQAIEQSLILLGQLRATQFSPLCVELLDHPKDEVRVSAAWLIHLFPDETIRDVLLSYIEQTEKLIVTPSGVDREITLKQAMLIQYGGLVRMREIQPMLETKFDKTAPGGYLERSAAMWTLGIFSEKNPDPKLAARFAERVRDRASMPPEPPQVRRMCVLALGLMRSTASVDVVREAYETDPSDTIIPGTARWVLALLGEPMPAEIPPIERFTAGWRLRPAERSREEQAR